MRLRSLYGLVSVGLCAGALVTLGVRLHPAKPSPVSGVRSAMPFTASVHHEPESRNPTGARTVRPAPDVSWETAALVRTPSGNHPAKREAQDPQHLLDTYTKNSLSFEAHQSQADAQAKFFSRGRGYSVLLEAREAVVALGRGGAAGMLRMKLVGANPAARGVGREPLPGRVNYYLGNDPKKWRTGVRRYAKVRYQGVYPGVDLVYYGSTALTPGGTQRQLEYDFVVAPGADPGAIALRFEGADKLAVDAQGDLALHTGGGEVRLRKPVVYQEEGGVRREIDSGYVLLAPENRQPTSRGAHIADHASQGATHEVGFQVAAYDPTRPLIIDPVLSYSTYLGGSRQDDGYRIAVDPEGNIYVCGSITRSIDFPTENPFQPEHGGGENFIDAFVTKFNPSGSALIYSTYLGGNGDDWGLGIAVDAEGNTYVVGSTTSTNFPTVRPFQAVRRGNSDGFLTKLDSSGGVVYSTYLGGSGSDEAWGVALDAEGNVYVAGVTASPDFPTAKPFQATLRGGGNAFVTKFDPSGSALIYSTYLGGRMVDGAFGIAVDAGGQAYVTGTTSSLDFPTERPFQGVYGGGREDAFVTKLDASGTALVYSTYLGGSGEERGYAIAVDAEGNAYVTGGTTSPDFPTVNPFQPNYSGGIDAFVTKFNPGGAVVYSTYLGGSYAQYGRDIAVDSEGNAYVVGDTLSTDFPTTEDAIQPEFGGATDAFITRFDASGTALVFSTYLGGRGTDVAFGVAVDAQGNIYVTGATESTDFPTRNPFQDVLAGMVDAFVAKISPSESRSPAPKK